MGDPAENTSELQTDTEELINPNEPESNEDGGEGTQPEKTFTQEEVNSILQERLSKRTKQSVDPEIERLKNENEVFRIAIAQSKEKPLKEPDPIDFDDGVDDPNFIKEGKSYADQVQKQEIKRQVDEAVNSQKGIAEQTNAAQALEESQRQHYERVKNLNVDSADEYFKREDIALDIFGQENINHFINTFDDSEKLLYYLGTSANRSEAEKIAKLLKTKPILGISKIGGIQETLKVKSPTKTAPDPDTNLKGMPPSKAKKRGPPGARFYQK